MLIRRIERTLRALDDRLHALRRRLDAPDARRLRALAARHQTLLLALALAAGILLMIVHWAGHVPAAPGAHAHGAAHGGGELHAPRAPALPVPRLQARGR
jgi:hypothetical protein